MCPGATNDVQQLDDARKTAVIDRELQRLSIDIACLQETRLPDSGSIKEANYTFWQGRPTDEPRQHGVGFAVKNTLLPTVEPPSEGTERIISLRISTPASPVTIFSVYAPTLCSSPEVIDAFYEALDEAVNRTPSTERLGDFNARVGAYHNAWPSCLGSHGTGKMNENGQRLLEMCCLRGLWVTNTFFAGKDHHKFSWRHPRSKHWHQLDLIITRRKDLNCVLHSLAATTVQTVTQTTPSSPAK